MSDASRPGRLGAETVPDLLAFQRTTGEFAWVALPRPEVLPVAGVALLGSDDLAIFDRGQAEELRAIRMRTLAEGRCLRSLVELTWAGLTGSYELITAPWFDAPRSSVGIVWSLRELSPRPVATHCQSVASTSRATELIAVDLVDPDGIARPVADAEPWTWIDRHGLPDAQSLCQAVAQVREVDAAGELPLADGGLVTLSPVRVDGALEGVLVSRTRPRAVRAPDPAVAPTARAVDPVDTSFRELVQALPDAVVVLEPDLTYRFINPAAKRLLGVPEDRDLVGRSHEDLDLPAEALSIALPVVEEVVRTGRPHHHRQSIELRGARLTIDVRFQPLFDQHGELDAILCVSRDLTDQAAARASLDRGAPGLVDAVQTSGLWVANQDGRQRYTWSVGGFEELHDLVGRTDREAFGEAGEALAAAKDDVLRTSAPCELTVTLPLGGRRPVFQVRVTAVRDDDGAVVGLSTVAVDITEVERVRSELQDARDVNQRILEISGSPIFVFDLTTQRLVYITPAMGHLLKVDVDTIRRNDLSGLATWLGGADVERAFQLARQLLTGEIEQVRDLELVLRGGDGEPLVVRIAAKVLRRLPDGTPWQVVGSLVDITADKRIAEQSRASEARLQTAQRAAGMVSWSVDAAGVLQWSQGAEELLGLDPSQVGTLEGWQRLLRDHVPTGEHGHVRERVGGAMSRGESFDFDLTYLPGPGRAARVLQITGTPSDDGSTWTGGVLDITERKREEDRRVALEARLQEAQRLESLGVLAGGVAHDFNNLLVGVLGNASLALMDAPPGTDLHTSLSEIEAAATRAAELASQMLAYSGRGAFVKRRHDLAALVRAMAPLLHAAVGNRAVLELDIPDTPVVVDADEMQIRQVVVNLVDNASEAVAEHGGHVAVALRIEVVDAERLAAAATRTEAIPGTYVVVEVGDDGHGIPPEDRARVFEPFYTTRFAGRGLGLAAAVGIARGHDGFLEVESDAGQGSRFRLLLPLAEPMALPEVAAPAGSGRRVLVVDDEPFVLRAAQRALESAGFTVTTARDGVEAVERLVARPRGYDVVLLDMTMPRMGGGETLAALRRVRDDLPVVLTSGYDRAQALERLDDAEVAGFLKKPWRPPELIAVLEGLVDGGER